MMDGSVNLLFEDETEALASAYKNGRDGGTIILLPDGIAIRQLKEALLKGSSAVDGSMFSTFEELAGRIVLAGTSKRAIVLPEVFRKLIAVEISEHLNSAKGGNVSNGDLAPLLLNEFDKIWPTVLGEWNEGKDLFDVLPPENRHISQRIEIIREFAVAYSKRMHSLADKGIFDRVTLAHEASKHVSVLGRLGIRKVVISGMVFADRMLLELIKSISGTVEVVLVFNPYDAGRRSVESLRNRLSAHTVEQYDHEDRNLPDAKIRGAPDKRRELREVARTILKGMDEDGMNIEDFGVFADSIENYMEMAEEIFREYGLEVTGGRKRISNIRLFTLLEKTLDLLEGDITKSRLIKLIEHDFFPKQGQDLRLLEADMAHLPDEAGEDLRRVVAGALKLEDGSSFWDWLESSRNFAANAKTLQEWSDFTLQLLGIASTQERDFEEYEGESELREMVAELSTHSAVAETTLESGLFGLAKFRELLEDIGGKDFFASEQRVERKVLFTDSGLAYFSKFKRIFVLGANEEVLPSKPRDGMFLRLTLLDWISQNSSMVRSATDATLSIEGHKYDTLLHAAASIIFSYVYADERGRRLLPSTFVLQTIEKISGGKNLLGRIESENLEFSSFYPEDGRAMSQSEFDRVNAALMSGGNTEMFRGRSEYQYLLSRKEVADSDPLEWDLPLEELRNWLDQKVLSASDLSEYSKCPFRYVASRVLGVYPVLPPLNPMDRGSQMHEILRRFYETHSLEFLRTSNSRSVAEELDRCADDYFIRVYGRSHELALRFALHVSEVKSSLREFISREIADESQMSGSITGLEQRFGFRDQKELSIGRHRYRGIIDRVETIDESGDTIVYDYKSGNPDNLTRKYFRAGKTLLDYGIPLYALYLRNVEGRRLAGAFYYMLLKSPGVPDKAGIANGSMLERMFPIQQSRRSYYEILDDAGMNDRLDRFQDEIEAISDRITACEFPAEPKPGECNYCRYVSICRYTGGL